jgi:hypothetical protein
MKHALYFALFAVATFVASIAAAQDQLPIVFQEDFENGADHWQPQDAAQWQIKKTENGQVYSQHKKQSTYKPPHRAPTNVSLLKDVTVSDMEFTGRVLSTHPDYGHRDAVVFFGYQDPAHFYYVHLGKQADDHAKRPSSATAAGNARSAATIATNYLNRPTAQRGGGSLQRSG